MQENYFRRDEHARVLSFEPTVKLDEVEKLKVYLLVSDLGRLRSIWTKSGSRGDTDYKRFGLIPFPNCVNPNSSLDPKSVCNSLWGTMGQTGLERSTTLRVYVGME